MRLCDNEDPIVVGVMVLMPQQCSACGEAVCSTRMCSHFSSTCFWQCVAIGLFCSVVGVMTSDARGVHFAIPDRLCMACLAPGALRLD